MAGAMKKVDDKIRQIVRLKQVMMRWKHMSLRHRSFSLHSYSDTDHTTSESQSQSHSHPHSSPIRRPPSGFLFVYVGPQRKRFVIPTRFLNLPIFVALLKQTEEEFGFRANGGLVFPCEVPFFKYIVNHLHKDELKYGKFSLDEFLTMISDVGSDSCKESILAFTPLLHKAKV